MVDDPYIFGQIAAVNALNDIYAMGGQPLLAMNLVMFPQGGDLQLLKLIIEGGLSKIQEAGALLVGGHSVDDNEPKYGLAVTGLVHPQRLITNSGAVAGDRLLLTKPLGSGIISTAIKADMADPASVPAALQAMTTLNRAAALAMQEAGVLAATDITGFGLLGHCHELCSASGVSIDLFTSRLPFITGARESAQLGLIPGGAYKNRDHYAGQIDATRVDPDLPVLLCSPETAGGLLIAAAPEKAPDLVRSLQQHGVAYAEIGRVTAVGDHPLRLLP